VGKGWRGRRGKVLLERDLAAGEGGRREGEGLERAGGLESDDLVGEGTRAWRWR
jgi:hypothetical protein